MRPCALRERIDRGDVVFNYGLQLVYRSQQNASAAEHDMTSTPATRRATTAPTREGVARRWRRSARLMVMPDVWFKLLLPGADGRVRGQRGRWARSSTPRAPLPLAPTKRLTMRQFGWVLASRAAAVSRCACSSDSRPAAPPAIRPEDRTQYLNYRWRFVQQPLGDHAINDFKFSPEYHVDEIFFRHILGTVTNAIYFKPQVAYWFDLQQTRQLGLTGAVIYSMAQVPVSTPGNALSYGIEMNVGLNYRNTADGFYAGLTWAVFWPFAALDRPADIWGAQPQGDAAGASAAQMLRAFFGIRF